MTTRVEVLFHSGGESRASKIIFNANTAQVKGNQLRLEQVEPDPDHVGRFVSRHVVSFSLHCVTWWKELA